MRRPAFRWEIVIKVGGSLGRRPRQLPPLMRRIARLAREQRLLIVPGGGVFADLVRRETRRHGFEEERAHRMALLAMDQYALGLGRFCPGSRPVTTLAAARRVAASGRAPILLASSLLLRESTLERSFRLTSDSIAAYVARRTGAKRLALMKSVQRPDGRVSSREELQRLARRGVVDPLFPRLRPDGVEVFILDGRRPTALLQLTPRRAPPARSPAQPRARRRTGRPGTG